MMILAIETTGPKASVAFINENGDITEKTSDEVMNHLKGLVPMIRELMDECGFDIKDIRYVAASVGPGSFTGIRIGVATARALAQSWAVQTISVPTLESFVYNACSNNLAETIAKDSLCGDNLKESNLRYNHTRDESGRSNPAGDIRVNGINLVCPVFDARRSQIYSGVYYLDYDRKPKTLLRGDVWDFAVFSESLERSLATSNTGYNKVTLYGDGLNVYGDEFIKWHQSLDSGIELVMASEKDRYQKASSVARLAYVLTSEGAAGHYSELLPVYLRKAEAERKREESEKSSD